MNYLQHLKENERIFFNFMKRNYPLYEQSNLFLRDMQYAIMSYFELKEKPLKYEMAEEIAKEFIKSLVKKNKLLELNNKTWKVNFIIESNKHNNTEVA